MASASACAAPRPSAATPLLPRRPPSLLLTRPLSRPVAASRSATAASDRRQQQQVPAPCPIEDAYYFVPSPAAVRAAAADAAAAAAAEAAGGVPAASAAAAASSSLGGAGGFYGGSPATSSDGIEGEAWSSGGSTTATSSNHQRQSQQQSQSPSFWQAVGGLAARAAEAAAPQVVLIPDALPEAVAREVARECRALRPRLAPELNCIASGRLGCYLSAKSATHAALSDPALAEQLTRRLRAARPLAASDYPMELRHYPSGASMPWHSDEALFGPDPQWELIYTVDNDSDSETEWRDARGALHGAWTPPGSLLCVRAEGWQHRVTPVRRGSRLIVKLAYAPQGAAKLPSFAHNLGRAAYGRPGAG